MIRFGIDIGGTFTDVVALSPDGDVAVGKVRSGREGVSPATWTAVQRLRATDGGRSLPAILTHGTTVATNALLERSGARTVLVTTAGFEDLLWLRRQDRADLYDLSSDHPPPPIAREDVIGVEERVGVRDVVRPLVPSEIERVVRAVVARSPQAVAISLLFSFRDAQHERRLSEALREALPGIPVAASHEVLPVFREYERTCTTAVEAYLRPVVSTYLARMAAEAAAQELGDFRVMASNGGTLSVALAATRAAALALSGPAGGVEGARLVAGQLGFHDLLTLDMGGTSADASVVLAGEPLMQASGTVGGLPLALPHVLIETVGAGGGSVAWVDAGGALRVGPRSARAMPGPACYGLGGTEATVTDAALVLGWLDPGHPLADDLRLDTRLAEQAVARTAAAAGLSVARCAEGIVEVATATMVRALRRVSVERGIDPRAMTLVAFGGAGPMFVCRLADHLGMRRALVPPHAGVLSALGLAAAPAKVEFAASVHRLAEETGSAALAATFAELARDAADALPGAVPACYADCRYPGQGYELTVAAAADGAAVARAFHAAHHARYGHADPTRPVELVNLRVVASRAGAPVALASHHGAGRPPEGAGRGALRDVAVGAELRGPFTLDCPDSTLRIEPGWLGSVQESGAIVLERS